MISSPQLLYCHVSSNLFDITVANSRASDHFSFSVPSKYFSQNFPPFLTSLSHFITPSNRSTKWVWSHFSATGSELKWVWNPKPLESTDDADYARPTFVCGTNISYVFDYDPDLYTKMVRYPLEVMAIFDIVLMNMVGRINPLFENHIQTRIFNLKSSTSVRNLNPSI